MVASSDVPSISGVQTGSHLDGISLFRRRQLVRFPFLVKSLKTSESNYLQADCEDSTHYPFWAPRDVDRFCGSYDEFIARGYGSFHVPLSLVGHGGTKDKPAPVHVSSNKFTRPQYSYFHLPVEQLAEFVRELHPRDRFVAFLLSPEPRPVHIYFDIDASTKEFGTFAAQEEAHVAHFVSLLAAFFLHLFKRTMDLSGLLLLQASNDKKISWHVHVRTEAFVHVQELKEFVARFRVFIERDRKLQSAYQLVLLEGSTPLHVLDLAPFGSNQNFRCPYNQKPGKNPLRPRAFCWDTDTDALQFTADKDAETSEVCMEVLFNAHPNLALPGAPDYVLLTIPLDPTQTKMTAQRSKRKQTASGESSAMISIGSGHRAATLSEKFPSSSVSRVLSSRETAAVKEAVAKHLGSGVQFDELTRVSRAGHPSVILGTCSERTANCPFRNRERPLLAKQHKRNRMRFELSRGEMVFKCFDPECLRVTAEWSTTEAHAHLLDPPTEATQQPSSSQQQQLEMEAGGLVNKDWW